MDNNTLQTWWWIRHAPPVNPDGLCYGQLDIDADFSNEARMKALAAILPQGSASWRASPLRRAFGTAVSVLAHRRDVIELTKEPLFMEQSFGDWEIMRIRDLVEAQDPVYVLYRKDPGGQRPPNGESMSDLFNRVASRIDEMTATLGQRAHVIVFAHGGSIRGAIARATGETPAQTLKNHAIRPLDGVKLYYDRGQSRWLPKVDRF